MAAHLYWRLNFPVNGAGGGVSMSEIALRETSGGPNFAPSGTPSASYENANAGNVLDGSTSTYWPVSAPAVSWYSQMWWQCALGSPKDLAEVVITSRGDGYWNDAPPTILVSWSDDGVNFTQQWMDLSLVFTGAAQPQTATRGSLTGASAARVWGIYVTNAGLTNVSLAELGLRATAGGTTFASGGTAYAPLGNYTGSPASNAFDGNINTFWTSLGSGPPQMLYYDLGAGNTSVLAQIALTIRNDGFGPGQAPLAFQIINSSDGTNFIFTSSVLVPAPWTTGGQTQLFLGATPSPIIQTTMFL